MVNNQKLFEELRTKYPKFYFRDIDYSYSKDNGLDITYTFEIEGLAVFTPTWHFDVITELINRIEISDNRLDELVSSLGMVELCSYWKLTCSPEVIVEAMPLSIEQLQWFKKLYWNNLTEFLYENSIDTDFDSFMNLQAIDTHRMDIRTFYSTFPSRKIKNSVLIPVGGGKDSCVTLDLLRDQDRYGFVINSTVAQSDCIDKTGILHKSILSRRNFDRQFFVLGKEGFLTGHIPFTQVAMFSALVAAYINGIGRIAFSNETSPSTNFAQDAYFDRVHPKSVDFEKIFRQYEKEYLCTGIECFSFLRPYSDLEIASVFSRLKQFHRAFGSCNNSVDADLWCCKCMKCLSTYIMLSPFLTIVEMDGIFGSRLLEDESLLEDFKKLCGFTISKPFDFAGSREDVFKACDELIRQYEEKELKLPYLLDYYKSKRSRETTREQFESYTHHIYKNHCVPAEFLPRLKVALNRR